jgi:hypothetical protein
MDPPMGSGEMSRPFARFPDGVQAEQPEVMPRAFPLDELIIQAGLVSEARQELLRCAVRIAPSFFMPLLAGVLIMVRPRWTYKAAIGATLVVFIIYVLISLRGFSELSLT